MQTLKNIFPKIYDFENLFSAYKAAISCKRYRADVMEYTHKLEENLHLQLNKKTCIRPTSMGIEFVGFRIWSTHRKLRKKTVKKLRKRLRYQFCQYEAGEIDKETLDRSIASYRGIMKHFNSFGLRQSLNEMYKKEVTRDGTEF